MTPTAKYPKKRKNELKDKYDSPTVIPKDEFMSQSELQQMLAKHTIIKK